MFFQDEPLNTESVTELWGAIENNPSSYEEAIKNFANYNEVFSIMQSQTIKYKGQRDYFPMPIKSMPWILFENVLTKDSNKTHMKRLFEFVSSRTNIFSKDYRRYVPEPLWGIRKKMLRSSTYIDERSNFTYNTYWHLTSLVLQTVLKWDNENSSQFFYEYMLTANPLLQFVAPGTSARGKRVIIYKVPIQKNPRNYYLNAFFVTDTKKLCDFMLNFPLRQWERSDSITYSTSKGDHRELYIEQEIKDCFGAWETVSFIKPENVHPELEDILDVIS